MCGDHGEQQGTACVRLFHSVTKTRENKFRVRGIRLAHARLWSFQSLLTWFWDFWGCVCGDVLHHGEGVWWGKMAPHVVDKRQRAGQSKTMHLRIHPIDLRPPARIGLLKFPEELHGLESKHSTHEPMRDTSESPHTTLPFRVTPHHSPKAEPGGSPGYGLLPGYVILNSGLSF